MCSTCRCWTVCLAATVMLVALTGCPNLDVCPPDTNTNQNVNDNSGTGNGNSNDNTGDQNGNTNDNVDNDNSNPCRAEPQTTADPDADGFALRGNAQYALLGQVETVPAEPDPDEIRSVAALDLDQLSVTPIPVPEDIAFSVIGNGASVAWADEFYDIYAMEVGDPAATMYYNAAPMSIVRIADVTPEWIVFYLQGVDAIQVIDRRDGAHRILPDAPDGSAFWSQRIWHDELIRFQPVGGVPTSAPGVSTGEAVAISLINGVTRPIAQTETISLHWQTFPLDGDWLYWQQLAADGLTQQILRAHLVNGGSEVLLEQAQTLQGPPDADVLGLVDATSDHLYVRHSGSFIESCPGTGSIGGRREFGYFEYRDLAGGVVHLFDYNNFECPPGNINGTFPPYARLHGARLVWRDSEIGDYVVMNPVTAETCRVDPFADVEN